MRTIRDECLGARAFHVKEKKLALELQKGGDGWRSPRRKWSARRRVSIAGVVHATHNA